MSLEALKNKNNTDISTKRIRYSEYIASLYAIKLEVVILIIYLTWVPKVNIKKLIKQYVSSIVIYLTN